MERQPSDNRQIMAADWERITPLFSYPTEIRKAIYTTNAIESVNMSLPKVTKNRCTFLNDESVIKLLYLALKIISKKWIMPIRIWKSVMNQFTIILKTGRRLSDRYAVCTKSFTPSIQNLLIQALNGTKGMSTLEEKRLSLITKLLVLVDRFFESIPLINQLALYWQVRARKQTPQDRA